MSPAFPRPGFRLHLPESWPVARDGGCPGEQAHGAIRCARLLTALLGPHVPSAATALLGGLQLRGETQGSVRAPGFRGGACCRLPYSPPSDTGGAPSGPRDGSRRTQWLRGGCWLCPCACTPPPHAVRVSGPRLLESETGILRCPGSPGSLTVRICQPCRAPSLSPSLCTGCACVSSRAPASHV